MDGVVDGVVDGACPSVVPPFASSGHGPFARPVVVESSFVDGWVLGVVLGAALADGSGLAAMTAAAPPTASKPTARPTVARPRDTPPRRVVPEVDGAGVDGDDRLDRGDGSERFHAVLLMWGFQRRRRQSERRRGP